MTGIRTLSGGTAVADNGALAALRGRIRGAVIAPGESEYEEARHVWNGTIDRRPGLIVRCRGAADVAEAVRFAAERDLLISICGGGHNVSGSAVQDGALMVDLREMRAVTVDPATRLVRAEGGAMLGDIDAATQPHGLAVPIGVASETGVAGLALGGGMGWLRRKHGLTCDNLVAATVVTATGETIAASSTEHADLLWALKGGGGNFGVVTEFTFQAYPIAREVPFYLIAYPMDRAAEGLRILREMAPTAPDELSMFGIFWKAPADPAIPEEHHGKDTLVFAAVWDGDAADGDRVMAPLMRMGGEYGDLSGSLSFFDVQKLFDADYPKGGRYYWKSAYLGELSDEAIDVLIERAVSRPSKESSLDVWLLGGAIGRVAPTATAYPHRGAPYLLGIEANWHGAAHDGENMAWARGVYADVQRFGYGGALYVNFPGHGEEGEDLVRLAYGPNYAELARVKAAYDPENRFRVNQNIRPES